MISKIDSILLNNFFSKGHERTIRAKKNIFASFIIKGLNIAIGLILVPLTIDYLDTTKYGIWITLSSIITWFRFFNIGLGNGLRNRFAESLAKGEHELARVYVSTTYFILVLIFTCVIVLFLFINQYLNWDKILNVENGFGFKQELNLLVIVVFVFFCLNMVANLITTILSADQKPAMVSFFSLIGNIIVLCTIFILTKISKGSLFYLGTVMSSIPVVVLVAANFWFFRKEYKAYKPSINFIDISKASDLFNLGFKFFIIQISAILLYQTNNIIISHLFGPAEVTPYNIVFKYFNILMMFFSIIVSPFWSAFTEAWVKNEIEWIKLMILRLFKIWGLVFSVGIIMLIASPWVYRIWIGNNISISFSLSAFVGIWIIVNTWNGIFSQFLNGVGKIKVQLVVGISSALLNVPLAFWGGKIWGINGVIVANILLVLLGAFIYPIQYFKLINSSVQGVWNK
ncbi:MAG: oligosaccharide flippase family protein [Ignavibacteria bacterium]|jgi:O-antigen/teichoic acid export membrane protein